MLSVKSGTNRQIFSSFVLVKILLFIDFSFSICQSSHIELFFFSFQRYFPPCRPHLFLPDLILDIVSFFYSPLFSSPFFSSLFSILFNAFSFFSFLLCPNYSFLVFLCMFSSPSYRYAPCHLCCPPVLQRLTAYPTHLPGVSALLVSVREIFTFLFTVWRDRYRPNSWTLMVKPFGRPRGYHCLLHTLQVSGLP